MAVEKEDGGQGLVLGRGADVRVDGQVGSEGFNFRRIHLTRMALVVKQDKAFNPMHVRFFGTDGRELREYV
jgi:hypothetical protein